LKTIHQYIAGSFVTTFLLALLVLCFVMSVGLLFKVTEYLAAGAPLALVMQFLWSGFPGTLSLSVPIAALVSALLVFGRLSSDGEISAMRACGIRLFDIMRMPLGVAAVLTLLCLHLNGTVAPNSSYARRCIRYRVKASDLLTLIQPGKFVDDFPGYRLFVGSREGEELRDLRILETLKSGALRETKAQRAFLSEEEGRLRLEMFQVSMDPVQEDRPGAGTAERMVLLVGEQKDSAAPIRLNRRVKDKLSDDLVAEIAAALTPPPAPGDTEAWRALSHLRTEFHKRVVLALACLCFVSLGVPLGIQAHRRQSSAGIVLCLAITACFYLFLIGAESLARHPAFLPHLLPWIPVLACFGLAAGLVARNP
jgi:lipopolysaccharide export system permease protein